jgi:gamma-butyrobetaine dioxygenase
VDGFHAVSRLAATSPEKLAILAEQPVRFSYRDESADLRADVSVVTLDVAGNPVAITLNNRSKGVPVGTPETVGRWYEAYFEFLSLLERPDARVVFRLAPGDVVVFDNTRVLHGRTAFSGGGERLLQGCYADIDGLRSTIAVLERGSDS